MHIAVCRKDADTTSSIVFFLFLVVETKPMRLQPTGQHCHPDSLTASMAKYIPRAVFVDRKRSCGYLIMSIVCCHSHCFRLNNTLKSYSFCYIKYVFSLCHNP